MRNVLGIPELVSKVVSLKDLSHQARCILIELIYNATMVDVDGALVVPVSPARLCAKLGIHRRSYTNYLIELRNAGIVTRKYYRYRSVIYLINVKAIEEWKDSSRSHNVTTVKEEMKDSFDVSNVKEESGGGIPERDEVREPVGVGGVEGSSSIFMRALEQLKVQAKKSEWKRRLVDSLVVEFGDEKSRKFYEVLIEKVSIRLIDEARRITMSACRTKEVTNPGGYFVGVLKRLLGVEGRLFLARLQAAYAH
ncbi:hypothetical protein [Candidatus Caldatribacterium sp.]|uniref:hypothetical protein n=1 Tax=Candidatus Caldatribacterium sp. TaxID=2282143 RepID=UPI00383C4F3F|nr:hypothetical protein [Candidatus Caldatribacterium sp.]